MATPTIGLLNYTSISTAEATTNWSTFDTLDPDIKKEGSNGITGTFRSDGTSGDYDHGSAPATAAAKHVRMWVNTTSVPYLDVASNGGAEFWMNDGTTTEYYTIFSSEDYYGGWFNMVVDCELFTTLTLANVEQWGLRLQYTSTAKNVDNVWVDYIRYLDGYYITGGTSVDAVELSDVAIADRGTTTLYGYGIIEEVQGVYLSFGKLQIGNGLATTYFEMEGEVLVFTDQPVADGLYAVIGNGPSADIIINNSTILTAGTSDDTRFDLDMSTYVPGSVAITNTVFQRGGVFTFASGQDITGNSFTDCQKVTSGGSDISGSSFLRSAVAADDGALYCNTAYTDTYFDNTEFTMGSNSHHAIDFGTLVTSDITLRNCSFNGFGSTDDSNDSTIRFLATSGSLTLSLVNCTVDGSAATTSTFSVDDAAGISVTVSIDPVTLTATAVDSTGVGIPDARILVKAADGTGPFPYLESVTISNSGTTATVSHTAHGMDDGDKVEITGASHWENNGIFTITLDGTTPADKYSYTMPSDPGSSPTGTITSTFVALYGTGDSSGEIQTTRVYASNQPVSGWARKSSSAPYYKTGVITGTVSSSTGFTGTAVLTTDQ